LDLWLKWVIEIGILNQSLMFKIYSFLLFLIIGQPSFPRMVRPVEWPLNGLALEEIAVRAGH